MCVCSRYAKLLSGVIAVAVSASWCTFANAVDLMNGDLKVHGFFTQSLVTTTDNNFLGQSDDRVSKDFREIGLNGSWRLTPDWHFSAELLSHSAGGTDNGEVRLDYGLLDWTAMSSEGGRGGIRLGRVKTAYGMYNTTRDVAFTRPSVILPQSIYFERTRNLTVSADGAEFYAERYGDAGIFSASFALGQPQTNTEAAKVALVGLNRPGKLESQLAPDLQLMYEESEGKYRLAFTVLHTDLRYRPGAADRLEAGRLQLTPLIFSAQYNAEQWSTTAEYAIRKTSLTGFGRFFYNGRAVGESYYVQGTYRLAPRWEGLLRYDAYYADRDDREGKAFSAATHLPGFTRFAKDWTVGMRFDVNPEFMLRAEVHRVDGTGFLAAQDNTDPLALRRRWNMFMLLGSFRF